MAFSAAAMRFALSGESPPPPPTDDERTTLILIIGVSSGIVIFGIIVMVAACLRTGSRRGGRIVSRPKVIKNGDGSLFERASFVRSFPPCSFGEKGDEAVQECWGPLSSLLNRHEELRH